MEKTDASAALEEDMLSFEEVLEIKGHLKNQKRQEWQDGRTWEIIEQNLLDWIKTLNSDIIYILFYHEPSFVLKSNRNFIEMNAKHLICYDGDTVTFFSKDFSGINIDMYKEFDEREKFSICHDG